MDPQIKVQCVRSAQIYLDIATKYACFAIRIRNRIRIRIRICIRSHELTVISAGNVR